MDSSPVFNRLVRPTVRCAWMGAHSPTEEDGCQELF
jgi:hypothetical protein